MDLKYIAVVSAVFVIFLVFYLSSTARILSEVNNTETVDKIDRKAIQNEAMRLQDLLTIRNLSVEDIALLDVLTQNDSDLYSEYIETRWMIEHNYSKHVSHSLNSVYWTANGSGVECPSDALSHVGLYLQFNETELAEDATREGEGTLEEWKIKAERARAINASYYPNLDEVLRTMERIVSDMHQGNYESARNKSIYLGEIGYC